MNHDIKHNFGEIFGDAKRASLTDNERSTMRGHLQAYMYEHAARAPFLLRIADGISDFFALFEPSPRTRFVPAVFALVLVVGVGTSYAAEQALPGDVLYPVKIYFNEGIKGSLAVSQASKAEWNTELMTRRLEEAETLTLQDRLTSVARADIQTLLLKSADNFDKSVAALASTDNGAVAVASVQSNLEASLEAHVKVLAALTEDVPGVQNEAQPIIAAATLQANDSAIARTSAEAIVEQSDSPQVMTAALSKKADANEALMSVRAAVAASDDGSSTTVKAAAKTAFKAEQSISKANANLKRGEYAKAFTIFQEAIRAAKSAQVNLDASARLNTELPATSTDEDSSHEDHN